MADSPMDEIVEVMGHEAADRLMLHFGGSRIWVPAATRVSADHPIAKVVGVEKLVQLARRMAGCQVYIRMVGMRRARERQMLERHAAGETISAIATAMRCNYRTVRVVLKRADREKSPMPSPLTTPLQSAR